METAALTRLARRSPAESEADANRRNTRAPETSDSAETAPEIYREQPDSLFRFGFSKPEDAPMPVPPCRLRRVFAGKEEDDIVRRVVAALRAETTNRGRSATRPPSRADVEAQLRMLGLKERQQAIAAAAGRVCIRWARGTCTRQNCEFTHVASSGSAIARAASQVAWYNKYTEGAPIVTAAPDRAARRARDESTNRATDRSWVDVAAPGPAPTTPAVTQIAAPPRLPQRQHHVFDIATSPEELRLIAKLASSGATRLEEIAKGFVAETALRARMVENIGAAFTKFGPKARVCLSPACGFVGASVADTVFHEREIHAKEADALSRLRAEKLLCLPSTGKSCWLTAGFSLVCALAQQIPGAIAALRRSCPAAANAIDNPSLETAAALAKAMAMDARVADDPLLFVERVCQLLPSTNWPTVQVSGCGCGAPPSDYPRPSLFHTCAPGSAADFTELRRALWDTSAVRCGGRRPENEAEAEARQREDAEDAEDDDGTQDDEMAPNAAGRGRRPNGRMWCRTRRSTRLGIPKHCGNAAWPGEMANKDGSPERRQASSLHHARGDCRVRLSLPRLPEKRQRMALRGERLRAHNLGAASEGLHSRRPSAAPGVSGSRRRRRRGGGGRCAARTAHKDPAPIWHVLGSRLG